MGNKAINTKNRIMETAEKIILQKWRGLYWPPSYLNEDTEGIFP